MEHTELPWYTSEGKCEDFLDFDRPCYIVETDEEHIAFCYAKSYAEYIVRARNAFPAMKKMLQEVVNVIEGDESEWWMDDPDRGGFDLAGIKAALAAGGE